MGAYAEYLDRQMNFPQLSQERKSLLKRISELRGGRDVLVFASDLSKSAPTQIEYSDILPFQDQLSNLTGKNIDIILETPGGFAEVVEDLVKLLRSRYDHIGVIIPGYAKSAGTIFAMACDEILMGGISALGPIDAQIMFNNKRFSAEAFLDGLKKIKAEVDQTRKLNPAYIPILQNISPGEIQHCENAQEFSISLVKDWLARFKFKNWNERETSKIPVTEEYRKERAREIAEKLCKHSDWLTHGRSIKIEDLQAMKLIINDYRKDDKLNEAITRYYTLLRMSFDTNIYKIFETVNSQIYKFSSAPVQEQVLKQGDAVAVVDFECPKCKSRSRIQANLGKATALKPGHLSYPVDTNVFKCPNCQTESNLMPIRLQIEAQSGKKLVK